MASNKLLIIGASGFAREVAWIVERINSTENKWDLIGFVDKISSNSFVNGYKVISDEIAQKEYSEAYFVCAIANTYTRERIINNYKNKIKDIKFATLIDPSAIVSNYVSIGEGTIVCAETIITTNIELGKHNIINLSCTICHDVKICDYVSLYPNVNISGNVLIENNVEVGTGTQIIQQKTIHSNSIIGAGAVVVDDIPANCTAVGCPAKPIKFSS